VDAIVFDWDGTLVDSLPAIYEANLRVLEEYGIAFDEERYRAAYLPDWRVMYRRLGLPQEHVEAAGARWLDLYAGTDTAALLPGITRSLQRLSDAGFVMGLVTAGDSVVVERQLERFGLGHHLPVRVFGDDDVPAKPHPDPLLLALRQLGRAGRVATARYVGDAPDDMRMARSVGAIGVGIESAIGPREALVAAGASEVHAGVAEFVDALLAASPATASATTVSPPTTSARAAPPSEAS
jgi:phosphoglycolate phosphatase-like HAD superfamily hydrolase